jgi:hypothetical protein
MSVACEIAGGKCRSTTFVRSDDEPFISQRQTENPRKKKIKLKTIRTVIFKLLAKGDNPRWITSSPPEIEVDSLP